jgi:hypothetical protein
MISLLKKLYLDFVYVFWFLGFVGRGLTLSLFLFYGRICRFFNRCIVLIFLKLYILYICNLDYIYCGYEDLVLIWWWFSVFPWCNVHILRQNWKYI